MEYNFFPFIELFILYKKIVKCVLAFSFLKVYFYYYNERNYLNIIKNSSFYSEKLRTLTRTMILPQVRRRNKIRVSETFNKSIAYNLIF